MKVIGTMSVGYDHLSMDEIKKRSIKVRDTATHYCALMFQLGRNSYNKCGPMVVMNGVLEFIYGMAGEMMM